jgi:hypothetical protein
MCLSDESPKAPPKQNVLQKARVERSLPKQLSKKSKNIFSILFYHVFLVFLGEGSQSDGTTKKVLKTTPIKPHLDGAVTFWASDPPT